MLEINHSAHISRQRGNQPGADDDVPTELPRRLKQRSEEVQLQGPKCASADCTDECQPACVSVAAAVPVESVLVLVLGQACCCSGQYENWVPDVERIS